MLHAKFHIILSVVKIHTLFGGIRTREWILQVFTNLQTSDLCRNHSIDKTSVSNHTVDLSIIRHWFSILYGNPCINCLWNCSNLSDLLQILKGLAEILRSKLHFFPDLFFFFHIWNEYLYTNLTWQQLGQKQRFRRRRGKSLKLGNYYPRG